MLWYAAGWRGQERARLAPRPLCHAFGPLALSPWHNARHGRGPIHGITHSTTGCAPRSNHTKAPPLHLRYCYAPARLIFSGGTGNTKPPEALEQSFTRTAPHASGPIYGPNAPAEVPPVDLRHSIRNLDENTSYAADPAIETANSMRRRIRGGLLPCSKTPIQP
jgi:hypothetical protein